MRGEGCAQGGRVGAWEVHSQAPKMVGIVARTVGMVHTSASRRQAGDGVQADDVLVKAPRMMGMGS